MKPLRSLLAAAMAAALPTAADGPEAPPESRPDDPAATRRNLEGMASRYGWAFTYKEDDVLMVATTRDQAYTDAQFAYLHEILDRLCRLLKAAPETLRVDGLKPHYVCLAQKPEFMAWVRDEARRREEPKLPELLERVSNYGSITCLDPAYRIPDATYRHVFAHSFTHQLARGYERLQGDRDLPGWLFEGLSAWMDGEFHKGRPGSSCVARVGYEGDKYSDRDVGDWKATVQEAVKAKDGYTRLGNLFTAKMDKLTGNDVAVSWHIVNELVAKDPAKFKAFVDGVLKGTKQEEAFKAAFGGSVDEWEKAWRKRVLAQATPSPKGTSKK